MTKPGHRGGPRVHIEFREHVLEVSAHGSRGDPELPGDVGVGQSFGHEQHDLVFTRCKRQWSHVCCAPLPRRVRWSPVAGRATVTAAVAFGRFGSAATRPSLRSRSPRRTSPEPTARRNELGGPCSRGTAQGGHSVGGELVPELGRRIEHGSRSSHGRWAFRETGSGSPVERWWSAGAARVVLRARQV